MTPNALARRTLPAALAVVAGCSVLSGCSAVSVTSPSSASATASAPPARLGVPTDFELPASVASTSLVTSDGKRTTLAQLRGRAVVLSDTMTLCAESCPVDTASIVQAARAESDKGDGARVVFVSLTVDPQRDTVPQIAAYRHMFTPPGDWQVATGATAQVNALWKALGVDVERTKPDDGARNWRTGQPLTYDIQHSDQVFFIDAAGHVRFVLDGVPRVATSAVPTTLQQYLNEEGHQNLASPAAETWDASDAEHVTDWLLGA